MLLRQDLRAPGVHQQVRVPLTQEPHRAGASAPGSGPSGRSSSSPPRSSRNRRSSIRASTALAAVTDQPQNDATSPADAGPNARR
ncbi:hypothetical protein BJF78_28420 [Pseudonocardia sp. CNS-139]|nr:hypothetical protein BJF78_28420 [Pseudonocardia sp. CNS-139]